MISNKSIKMEQLIDYQNDAVVSKTLIKKAKGTVTVFAFDKGQGLSEHTAPFDAMVQIIEGKGNIILDSISNVLEKHEMIIMPANISHAIKAPEKFKMLLTMIKE
jgi:quercetin dioxygenase-like cupin family protein